MERNIKLDITYIGSAYCGWQSQRNGRTVQETLAAAIEKLTGAYPKLHGCGRTDAGVHAKNYCCSFRTPSKASPETFVRGLNALLPRDIAVKSASEAAPDFHARFSVTGKKYEYYILNSKTRDPFREGRALHYPYPLDEKQLDRAAKDFLGEHDFSAFCAAGGSVKDKVRTITEAYVRREGDVVVFSVAGNGFLYNMVRIMVGTLLAVAQGKIAPDAIPAIIASGDRDAAGATAKPQGLYLSEVYYD